MSGRLRARRALIGFILSAGAIALPHDRAIAQAGTNVSLQGSFPGCNSADPGAPSGTPTSQAWIASQSTADCEVRGSAFSYLGVVGASARSRVANLFPFNSFFVRSDVSSGWSETVRPGMSARYLGELDVKRLTLKLNLGATGSVSATRGNPDGGGASASIRYDFVFGSASGFGSKSFTATLPPVERGDFGTISRTMNLVVDGASGFQSFGFTMSSSASALVTNGGLDPASDNVADANFGSTLVWGGVQEVRAFDSAGNEVTLGNDAAFSLMGEQTGNDYVNPAVVVTPEPSSMMLLGTGLLGLFGMARQKRKALAIT